MLGGKVIDITKGVSTVPVKPGAELRSAQVEDIPQLMGEMKVVLDSLQTIVTRVDNLLGGGLLRADADDLLYFDERISAPAAPRARLKAPQPKPSRLATRR